MTDINTDETEVQDEEDFVLDLDYSAIPCPNIDSTQLQCLECQLELDNCTCILDWDTTEIDLFCTACNANHMGIDIEHLLSKEFDFVSMPEAADTAPKGPTPPRYTYTDKCRHYNVALEFPDGTTVYASSKHNRKPDEPAPDFGMYLDGSWKPACPAYMVTWIDYGLPVYHEAAAKAIIDTYNKAREGMWVEVGCIGGHGRTGTALACMAVLAGLSPKAAVKFVRNKYCDHAVEAKAQEWYIEWFAAYVHGGVAPARVEKSYHKDEPDTVYPAQDFKTPLGWKEFSINDNPQGEPPSEICETVRDRYVTVSYHDENGKYKSWHVEPDDDEFQFVYDLAMEQRKNPPKDNATVGSGPVTLSDMIGVLNNEPEPF